jgi:hypothetical protein
MTGTFLRWPLAALMAATALCSNASISSWPSWSRAEAVIGRPLTPMSYAGVARRTTRREVYAGAAMTTAAVATTAAVVATTPVYAAPGPGCMQVVNSYGQIMYQCP